MPDKVAPKVLSWASILEYNTLEQAKKSSELPFVKPYVALMPDAHFGYGSTVGSVIPTEGAIIPSAVGVDIGCGMIATRLSLKADQLKDNLEDLHTLIAEAVPAGAGQGHGLDRQVDLPQIKNKQLCQKWWTDNLIQRAESQMGSLGGGNHFVEICLDEYDGVWVVLHSGSRGVGNILANIHIDRAKGLMKQWFIELDEPDLAYLVEGTQQFHEYITDMLWAQEYALENRALMMKNVLGAIREWYGHRGPVVTVERSINCHHNYTERENHKGKNLWITRKGAVRAREGDWGVIPGSMGAASYIVSGLGNDSSFHSCSHGAGRTMGRKEAERTLSYESLEQQMSGKTWNRDARLIDEHPQAYKDIDQVMEDQEDLVKIEYRLHQILNYKGVEDKKRKNRG